MDGYETSNAGSDNWDRKPTTVPELEKMASVSVAIALWNHATVRIPDLIAIDETEGHYRFNKELRSRKWIDALPIPKSLAESIEPYFYSLSFKVDKWISYIYREACLTREMRSELYRLIDRIIWHPIGTINSVQTARNLLKSRKLTNPEKFRLACTYCLQEDVERLWPKMDDENDLIVTLQFSDYPLFCYWIYYCVFQLHKIQTQRGLSLDESMIRQRFVNNWSAIEYFFDQLDSEQQVTQAIWLIGKKRKSMFQELVLMKLNESQRERVIMDRFVQIMANYTWTRNTDDNDLAISTWHYARDLIAEIQFFELFSVLLKNRTEDFVLTEIWNTAREDFKRDILNYGDNDFVEGLLEWWKCSKEKYPNFVSTVMGHVSLDTRREITKKQFFSERCEEFICKNAVEMLDHLINLCLPEATESTEFKHSLAKTSYFKNHCKELVFGGKIEELVNLLEFAYSKTNPSSAKLIRKILGTLIRNLDQKCLTYYSTGNLKGLNDLLAPLVSLCPEIISDYKSKLLMSRAGFKDCVNLFGSTSDALNEIIADGFSPDLATKFKKRIIFSAEGIDKLQNMIVDGSLNDAEKWTRRFLESDTDREIMRDQLIDLVKKGKCKVDSETRKRFLKFLL